MSRDRLKDVRGGYADTGVARQPVPLYEGENPYSGYAQAPVNQYAQPPGPPPTAAYSQPPVSNTYAQPPGPPPAGYGEKDAFFTELAKVQDLIADLQQKVKVVGELQSQRLANTNESFQSRSQVELDKLNQETTALAQRIRKGLQVLMSRTKKLSPQDPDYRVQRQQVEAAQAKFKATLEDYSAIEKANRDKYRERMARQVRIVKPDATDYEVKEAVEGGGGTQVFANALMQSRQSGARAAYAEVQARHNDLMQLESKIIEIAQMVNQIGTMVQEQDEQVVGIEATAGTVQTNMKGGLAQTQGAVRKAKRYRMLRWCCAIFWIIVIIVVVVAVAVEETKDKGNN